MASRTTRCWEAHQSVLKAVVIITKTILPFAAKRSCSEWQKMKVNVHDPVSGQHRHRAQEASMSQASVGFTATDWGYRWDRYCDLRYYDIWRRVVWHTATFPIILLPPAPLRRASYILQNTICTVRRWNMKHDRISSYLILWSLKNNVTVRLCSIDPSISETVWRFWRSRVFDRSSFWQD